jgi:hypothetical protein
VAEVTIYFDVKCRWQGTPPTYRIFFDQELLAERSYLWDNTSGYVRECARVRAGTGQHTLEIHVLGHSGAEFWIENVDVQGIDTSMIDVVLEHK